MASEPWRARGSSRADALAAASPTWWQDERSHAPTCSGWALLGECLADTPPTVAYSSQGGRAAPNDRAHTEIERLEADPAHGLTPAQWAEILHAIDPCPRHGYHPSHTPLEPTDTEPGSEAKIRVMRARIKQGLDAHHPCDRTLADPLTSEGPAHAA